MDCGRILLPEQMDSDDRELRHPIEIDWVIDYIIKENNLPETTKITLDESFFPLDNRGEYNIKSVINGIEHEITINVKRV